MLAGEGNISIVGVVPGKLSKASIPDIARILNITEERINKEVSGSYVKEDTFVELSKISQNDSKTETELLKIAGIKISNKTDRVYPYGEAMSNLIGYVQKVAEEEIKENHLNGYSSEEIIGKAGIEKSYDEKLRGQIGYDIYIVDNKGNKKKTLITRKVKQGEDVKLTIDADIQKIVYEQFKNDESATVVLEPKTGEILAMCSTPSYDSNDFIIGFSKEKWNSLTNDKSQPLYNRCLAAWVPGSSLKPIIGAIALDTRAISENEDLRN